MLGGLLVCRNMNATRTSRTVFWLSLKLFILVLAEGFDLRQAHDVCDGVFDAFEGDDEADPDAEP